MFTVPEYKLNIPSRPITSSYHIEVISEALERYKSETIIQNNKSFGTFKLRLERAKYLTALMKSIASRDKLNYTLELGSGASTIIFGKHVAIQHTAVEHLEWCHDRTSIALLDYGVDEKAEVILRDLDDSTGMYKLQPNDIKGQIDLLLIDGPPVSPKRRGRPRWERFNTLPYLLPHLSPDAIVVLDSVERKFEQECLDLWVAQYGIAFDVPGDLNSRLKGFGIIDPFASTRA